MEYICHRCGEKISIPAKITKVSKVEKDEDGDTVVSFDEIAVCKKCIEETKTMKPNIKIWKKN